METYIVSDAEHQTLGVFHDPEAATAAGQAFDALQPHTDSINIEVLREHTQFRPYVRYTYDSIKREWFESAQPCAS